MLGTSKSEWLGLSSLEVNGLMETVFSLALGNIKKNCNKNPLKFVNVLHINKVYVLVHCFIFHFCFKVNPCP